MSPRMMMMTSSRFSLRVLTLHNCICYLMSKPYFCLLSCFMDVFVLEYFLDQGPAQSCIQEVFKSFAWSSLTTFFSWHLAYSWLFQILSHSQDLLFLQSLNWYFIPWKSALTESDWQAGWIFGAWVLHKQGQCSEGLEHFPLCTSPYPGPVISPYREQ